MRSRPMSLARLYVCRREARGVGSILIIFARRLSCTSIFVYIPRRKNKRKDMILATRKNYLRNNDALQSLLSLSFLHFSFPFLDFFYLLDPIFPPFTFSSIRLSFSWRTVRWISQSGWKNTYYGKHREVGVWTEITTSVHFFAQETRFFGKFLP